MQQLMPQLKATISSLQQLMDERLHRYNLTRAQTEIMMLIGMENGIEHRALLERLGVTSPTLTSVLNDLEKRGLLRRDVSEKDARVRLIFLTEDGRQVANDVQQEAKAILDIVFQDFSPQEIEMLSQLLGRIVDKSTQLLDI